MKADLKDLLKEAWLRQRERGLIVWTTREGKEIPINEMSDTHLVNTINMLIRNQERSAEELDHMEDFDPVWDVYFKDEDE